MQKSKLQSPPEKYEFFVGFTGEQSAVSNKQHDQHALHVQAQTLCDFFSWVGEFSSLAAS